MIYNISDIYNTYDDTVISYSDTTYFNNRAKTYEFKWSYQDAVELTFTFTETYKDNLLRATVYNTRGEIIYTYEGNLDSSYVFHFPISSQVSTKYFIKGNYSCGIQTVSTVNNSEELNTILPDSECAIYVR